MTALTEMHVPIDMLPDPFCDPVENKETFVQASFKKTEYDKLAGADGECVTLT
jgi:hypothetical protein